MVRLTDRPDMTLDVYRGRKTTMQQQQQQTFQNYADVNFVVYSFLRKLSVQLLDNYLVFPQFLMVYFQVQGHVHQVSFPTIKMTGIKRTLKKNSSI